MRARYCRTSCTLEIRPAESAACTSVIDASVISIGALTLAACAPSVGAALSIPTIIIARIFTITPSKNAVAVLRASSRTFASFA